MPCTPTNHRYAVAVPSGQGESVNCFAGPDWFGIKTVYCPLQLLAAEGRSPGRVAESAERGHRAYPQIPDSNKTAGLGMWKASNSPHHSHKFYGPLPRSGRFGPRNPAPPRPGGPGLRLPPADRDRSERNLSLAPGDLPCHAQRWDSYYLPYLRELVLAIRN
jgi:hypothetical protein